MIDDLLSKYPIISDQVDRRELAAVLRQLMHSLEIPGDVVEMGCYVGTTSLFISRTLERLAPDKQFHVYDSFSGLPEKRTEDQSVAGDQFVAGALCATKKQFIEQYKKAGLALPVIHKGWFEELAAADMPSQICFAFLDGDYYSSIKTSLALIEPHLAPGAIVVVDDYQSEALPGAARALDEWARRYGYQIQSQASLGIIHLSTV